MIFVLITFALYIAAISLRKGIQDSASSLEQYIKAKNPKSIAELENLIKHYQH
jgi:hypothetical protein